MKLRLTALSVTLIILMTGCAAVTPQPAGSAGNATFGKDPAEPALRGALIFECRTSCSVSPGAGCC